MTRICPECKKVHPDNAEFCQDCGRKLINEDKKSYLVIVLLIIFCFLGLMGILGIMGMFSPDTNSIPSPNIETTANSTWHSVANFTGKGDDETTSIQIRGSLLKIKIEVESSHYGTAAFYIYPEGKTVDYVGQGSVSSFSKSSAADEFNITIRPGSYYLKVEAEDQSNLDMGWEIKVFDYY